MMARTQITLDPALQRQARRRAAALGVSFAEYVRRVMARDLRGGQPKRDPSVVFDLGSSQGSDVARNKDAMIAEAISASAARRRRR